MNEERWMTAEQAAEVGWAFSSLWQFRVRLRPSEGVGNRRYVYEYLVELPPADPETPDPELEALLAEEAEIAVNDVTGTLTVTLRDGVSWSFGTTSDVSCGRVLNELDESEFVGFDRDGEDEFLIVRSADVRQVRYVRIPF